MQYDAVGLATLIAEKEVTATELLELSYARLAQVNDIINAVTYVREEQARTELEQLVNQATAFRGVPMFLKDGSQTIQGERSTFGAKLFREARAPHTSYFVAKLYAAGLVSLGSTTTPEFALKNITEATIHGPTRNPWNCQYSPGGSSGGAAALVAAGVVPIAGASDGGGSIRIPASFSGLVGLKPTRGRTPVGPGSGRIWHGAAIDFVLTRSVRDAARCLDELQVVQDHAAFQTPFFPESYEAVIKAPLAQPLRIAFTTDSPVGTPVSAAAKAAVDKVAKWFAAQGHHVEEAQPPIDGKQLMRDYFLMNSGEIAALMTNVEKQLGRTITADDVEIETWLLYRAGLQVSAVAFSQSLIAWDLAAEQMALFHDTYDIYLTPATAYPAPKIGELTKSEAEATALREQVEKLDALGQQELIYDMFLPSLTYTPFTQLANLTGQPAISLPVHITDANLPLGVQMVARKGKEHLLLQLAYQLEQTSLWVHVRDYMDTFFAL